MNNKNTYIPPYYCITVIFKPKDIIPYKSSERKSVSFQVDDEKDREAYYEIAAEKAIERDIIDEFGIEYWEPYRLEIDVPSLPAESAEVRHF